MWWNSFDAVFKQPQRVSKLLKDVVQFSQEYIVDAQNFSQFDVNEGRVLYEHLRPFSNLTAFDVISLEAMAEYVKRNLDLVLNIRISVTSMMSGGGIDKFIGTENIAVEEGGTTPVHTHQLNTSGILDFIEQHRQQGVAIERFFQQQPQQRKVYLQ